MTAPASAGEPPAFDTPVAPGGYVWWYVDALSDDGRHGLTVIAFLGSVFSPYYAWARHRHGAAAVDPLDHCAVNVALYGRGGTGPTRWTMTERGHEAVERGPRDLRIGPSTLRWQNERLVIALNEVGMPWPRRVRGTVTVHPLQCFRHPVVLSERGGHRWYPVAPAARVEVALDEPGLRWSGDAYVDSNRGDAPLEEAFGRWHWSRAHRGDGRASVFYDVERPGQPPLQVALGFAADGRVAEIERPPEQALPASRWRVARTTRSDPGHAPKVVQTLTDAPFYARSLVEAHWSGERVTAVHESLSMPRFVAPWVQAMLPFRMPRGGPGRDGG